jgi:phosphatidylinositol alpha-1,6-mannosyltransferase
MKKILIITLEFPPTIGGIATFADSMAEALGERAIVLAPEADGAAGHDAPHRYAVIRKKLLFPSFVWPRWLRLVLCVRAIVKKEPVGAIVVHHALPSGYAARIAQVLWGIPFAVFYHGTDVHKGTASSWKRRMLGMVSGKARMNFFDSAFLRSRFLERVPGVREEQCRVFAPAPEPMFFTKPDARRVEAARAAYALHGKKVLLSVGRLAEGKGYPHLLRVFAALVKHMPNLVWVIAGDGPKREELAKLTEEQSLQYAVRFLGAVPRAELPVLYALADVFALLTHPDEGREEGYGFVFAEAAAAGVPVVAGRGGGVAEAVIDRETGLVVDARIPAQVEAACMKLFTDRSEALRMAAQARARVQTSPGWDALAANIHIIFPD